jgi:hypothetical protein
MFLMVRGLRFWEGRGGWFGGWSWLFGLAVSRARWFERIVLERSCWNRAVPMTPGSKTVVVNDRQVLLLPVCSRLQDLLAEVRTRSKNRMNNDYLIFDLRRNV